MIENNYFVGTNESPYHLSIGAIVFDKDGKILCHHYLDDGKDTYILMRETMEAGESCEDTLNRGLIEEFGAKVTLDNFVGSIKSSFSRDSSLLIEKTTLYFICDLVSIDESLRAKEDAEKNSKTEFLELDDIIQKSKSQSKYNDLDESVVLERAKAYRSSKNENRN